MADTIMVVFSNPTSPEQEEEYNTWYNQVHLKELLDVPGIVKATRYRLAEGGNAESAEHRYMAVYELDRPPREVLAELHARTGAMTMSPALDTAGTRLLFWEPVEGGSR